jgi:hypothetical protein
LNYLNAEFTWGSQGQALEASEPFVTDATLALGTCASAALRQAYFVAQGHDQAILRKPSTSRRPICFDTPNPRHTLPCPVEFPIRRYPYNQARLCADYREHSFFHNFS